MPIRNPSQTTAGSAPTSPGAGGGAAYWFAGTWAGLQAATTADLALGTPTLNAGLNVAWVQDFGGPRGMEVEWTGTRWKWRTSRLQLLRTADFAVQPAGPSENIAQQLNIPAGLLLPGDCLRAYMSWRKGAAGGASLTARIRLGTLGTSSDAAIHQFGPFTGPSQMAGETLLQVIDNTNIRVLTTPIADAPGTLSSPMMSFFSTTSTTTPSNVVVPNLATTDTVLSVTSQMSDTSAPVLMAMIVEAL